MTSHHKEFKAYLWWRTCQITTCSNSEGERARFFSCNHLGTKCKKRTLTWINIKSLKAGSNKFKLKGYTYRLKFTVLQLKMENTTQIKGTTYIEIRSFSIRFSSCRWTATATTHFCTNLADSSSRYLTGNRRTLLFFIISWHKRRDN